MIRIAKWHRCYVCQLRKPIARWKSWASSRCVAAVTTSEVDSTDTPPAVAEQMCHDQVRGKLDEVRKARSERAEANRESRAHNRCSVASAHAAASCAIPSVAPPATAVGEFEDGGRPPSWIGSLVFSHHLFFAGGIVWCAACGSYARNQPRRDHALSHACKGRGIWKGGPRVRIMKLSEGTCPWETWPDGRASSVSLHVRRYMPDSVSVERQT